MSPQTVPQMPGIWATVRTGPNLLVRVGEMGREVRTACRVAGDGYESFAGGA